MSEELGQIWKKVLGELEVELGKSSFGLYFKNSQLLELDKGVAKLGFSNKIMADQVNARYYSILQTTLQKIAKIEKVSLVFEIAPIAESGKRIAESIEEAGPLFEKPKEDKEAIGQAVKKAGLRTDFSLEEFCVSTSNQLAFAAAQSVIKNPGKNYNPLFLWGGVGVGKTHLMQAIGHEILRVNSNARVVYASGEQFTNEIILAIRRQNTAEIKEKYRFADALLIDDVQFLSGKDTAQEEFFHTFNAVQQHAGQIVMTSDRKPSDISDLTDRLRSRFEGGLVADISTPDSELKTAICLLKFNKRGIDISNSVASLIAGSVDNIRTLEGALQRLMQEVEVKKIPLTEDLVSKVLKVSIDENLNRTVKVDNRKILDSVCEFYGLPIKLIKGDKRDRGIARPRQVLMYLLKNNTGMTLVEIADFLGGRDHTTIMHGVRKIEQLVVSDERIKNEVDNLWKKIEE